MVNSLRWVCMGLLMFGLVGCNSSKDKKRQIRRGGGGHEKGRVQQPFKGAQDSSQQLGQGSNPVIKKGALDAPGSDADLAGDPSLIKIKKPKVDVQVGDTLVSVQNSPLLVPIVQIKGVSTTDNKLTYAEWISLDPLQKCMGDISINGCNSILIDDNDEFVLGAQDRTRAITLKVGELPEQTEDSTDENSIGAKSMLFQLPVADLFKTKEVETLVVFRKIPKFMETYQSIKTGLEGINLTNVSARIFPVDITQNFFHFEDLAKTIFKSIEEQRLNIDAHRIIFNITDTENGCINYTSGQDAQVDCSDVRNPHLFANTLKDNGLLATTQVYDIILSSETDLEQVKEMIETVTREQAQTRLVHRSFYLPHKEGQINLDTFKVKIDGADLEVGNDFAIFASVDMENDKLQIHNLDKLSQAQQHIEISYELK